MAKYLLLKTIQVGGGTLRAGSELDSDAVDISKLVEAGGQLWDLSNPLPPQAIRALDTLRDAQFRGRDDILFAAISAQAINGGGGGGGVNSVGGAAPVTSTGGANPVIGMPAATPGTAGYMSGADKTKLDGIASGATATALSNALPAGVGAQQAGGAGASPDASRADHTHATVAGPAVTVIPDQANAEGASSDFARSDHVHNVPSGAPVTIGVMNASGTAPSFALSDHLHDHGAQTDPTQHALATGADAGFMAPAQVTKLAGIAPGATATPLSNTTPAAESAGAVGSAGVATDASRSDHLHALAAGSPVDIGTANADGASGAVARADHVHAHGAQTDPTLHAGATGTDAGFMSAADKVKLMGVAAGATNTPLSAATPVTLTPNLAGDAGVATDASRSDHAHGIATGVPVAIGTGNAGGGAATFARADHVHDHGAQTTATHHAVATGVANGFMSAADKTKLDALAGAVGTAEVDFGAWPGADIARLNITGQAGILLTSVVQAWLFPKDTADHSEDEHHVEHVTVAAGNIVAGVGFTITAQSKSPHALFGLYSVAWRW